MKVKRLHEMSELERALTIMIWDDVKELPHYDCWRKYERGFIFEDKKYRLNCKFRIEDGYLRLIDTDLTHEQVVIDLIH